MGGNGPTILQIIPRLDAGGAELAVIDMAEAVTLAGGRALVLSEGGRLAPQVAAAGGTVIEFPAATKNPLRIWSNAEAVCDLVRRQGIALLHARSRAPAWSALIAARRARLPFVTTYHGAYKESGALKRAYNSVMARGDVVIANSAFTAGLIRQRYRTPEARIAVIHRGLDPAAFDPARVAPDRIAALRAAWGVKPGQRVILHPARLTSWKGQSVVIESAALLRASGRLDDAVVVLAGDPQGRAEYVAGLDQRIDTLGLAGHVLRVGHVSDMPAAYLAAHVTLVASTEPEAFGRTVIEAAAMRCPVIATALGAPPEIIKAPPKCEEDQATGWLVAPGQAWALAEQVHAALRLSQPQRERLGERARAHVLAHYTKRNLQLETLAVYDRLLGTGLAQRFRDRPAVHAPLGSLPLQS
ncbi:MAG: glycosyltransferase family 4 protein [Hyphomicrobiaceae bacterium]|nr:glycosyltransferase family 4 protein [Hyphomicrobiaceae bacterium]